MMSRIFSASVLLLVLLLPATGCNDGEGTFGPSGGSGDLESRVDDTCRLALSLYEELSADNDNFLVSSHSLAVAFGMVYAGAMGETEREIADALFFDYPNEEFHPGMKELNDLLNSRGDGVEDESFVLNLTNGCWGREDFTYLQSYTDLLEEYYGASIGFLDFELHPEESRQAINQWVKDETGGRIEDLIPPDAIDQNTYMILANTIYFKAAWLSPFDTMCTFNMPFHLLDGSEVEAPMMGMMEKFAFVDGDGYKAIEFPYVGEEVSMLVLLPDRGMFEVFEQSLSASLIDEIVGSLDTAMVSVGFPKFSFSSSYDMKPVLESLGMSGAFYMGANFTGMDGTDDGQPFISFVVQKTFISVDEAGTEAAAATGIGMALTSINDYFLADSPFIFAIRDIGTGTIIFIGRVVNPAL